MQFVEHGGGCCGINHVLGFGNQPTERFSGWGRHRASMTLLQKLDEILKEYIAEYDSDEEDKYFNVMLEAVLTDEQMVNWAAALKERKFKLVNRFYNSNSGNYCNVLHYTPHEPRGRNRRPAPYKW